MSANYNGRTPNTTSNIKYFVPGQSANLWKPQQYLNTKVTPNVYENVITPSSANFESVYIPGDLFVDGNIINPSDLLLKNNIVEISTELSDKIMRLKPTQFTFKSDKQGQIHYGFIAQEVQQFIPDIVRSRSKGDGMLSLNYNEIIPVLVEAVKTGISDKESLAAAYLQLCSLEIQRTQNKIAKDYFRKAKALKPKSEELVKQIKIMDKQLARMPG